ncbi:Sec-independent protein translocase subunit TatA [Pseudoalteromonas sp. SSDWG2]|uniref:Sec-independent protein translocase subunit TatA n=1 Tax=Pseudoalteromonas sp. SSDWG2 TaxID=3139391 RepID=UPI003BAC3E5B
MGIGGISIWQLLIILAIIILIFGTKKLRNLGGDLGNAVKGFKNAVADDDKQAKSEQTPEEQKLTQSKEQTEEKSPEQPKDKV